MVQFPARLRIIIPLKALLVAGFLSAGAPWVRAQMAQVAPPGQTFQPMMSNQLTGRGEDAMSIYEKTKGKERGEQNQQAWRITKPRDFARLPPEFQWDVAPTPIHTPFPIYPFELLRKKTAGKVQAFFIIGPDGRVIVQRIDGGAAPEFVLAVRAMLDSCRFNPAKKKDGTPAYANLGIEYDFQPKGRTDAPVAEEGRLILRDLEKKPGSILTLQELDQPLKPVSRQAPAYPSALLAAGPAGEAEVEFFVDMNGSVQLPRIVASSAPEFGYAAVQAVAAWRFEPPLKGGKAVVVRVRLPIGFEGRKTGGGAK